MERTRRGARLVQDDAVLSEVLARPGPTHGVFDVLAACVALAPGPGCLVLGFAAGGLMAPLRALGWAHPIEAVDRSLAGEELFRELTAGWGGPVEVHRAEARSWLARRRRRFELILEDLSVPSAEGVIKPGEALGALPALIARRLSPGGIAVSNLLPRTGISWKKMLGDVRRPFRRALVVELDDYQNRVLLGGEELEAAAVSRRLRESLRRIGSRQARKIQVRSLLS